MDLELMEEKERAEAARAINDIVDPCSKATGCPIGLVDMGIASVRSVEEGVVNVLISPTFPGCRFAPIFEGEIRERLKALEWYTGVAIDYTELTEIWTEERMSEVARARLWAHRQEVRERAQSRAPRRDIPLVGAVASETITNHHNAEPRS
jgi:metal-sulfur cluster biosynthetic enzyme